MFRSKATKIVHLVKFPYPIGTVNKPPFQQQILTERVLHVAHSNTYRVVGGKFQIPTQNTAPSADSEAFDVSSSIDHLLHENKTKKVDDNLKKLREMDWENSDAFGKINRKSDNSEKRNYLRKLFASTNNQLNNVIITKLSVAKDLDVEKYFESGSVTDYSFEVNTEKIVELRHVDIEDLEFSAEDGSFELRLSAATSRVLEERKQMHKRKQRRNFLIGVLLILGFLGVLEFASERLSQKTEADAKKKEESGELSRSGEDISKDILQFAKQQNIGREQGYLEEKMKTVSIPAIDRIKGKA